MFEQKGKIERRFWVILGTIARRPDRGETDGWSGLQEAHRASAQTSASSAEQEQTLVCHRSKSNNLLFAILNFWLRACHWIGMILFCFLYIRWRMKTMFMGRPRATVKLKVVCFSSTKTGKQHFFSSGWGRRKHCTKKSDALFVTKWFCSVFLISWRAFVP